MGTKAKRSEFAGAAMNLSQLQQGLEQAFYTEQHRIVFWYDAEQSFSDKVQALKLNDVQIQRLYFVAKGLFRIVPKDDSVLFGIESLFETLL